MWINGLTAKAAEWKGKSGVRTAVTLSGAGPVAHATAEPEPSNFGTVTREAGDEAGGAVAEDRAAAAGVEGALAGDDGGAAAGRHSFCTA